MTQLRSGSAAPSFTLADTEGHRVGFDPNSPGRKLLVFYKVTCPTCQFGMPYYDRLFQAFSGSGIPMFAVAQDDAQDAQDFARTYSINMPQLTDNEPYDVSNAYKVQNVPTFFIVGDDGTVEVASASFVRQDIERAAELLAESAQVEPPQLFAPEESVPDFRPG